MTRPARRWLLVAWLLAISTVVVVVAAVVSVATDDSATDDRSLAVLDVPSIGDTEPGFLRDGRPVFITHDVDGTVMVIEAVSTHNPDDPMAWCASSRTIDAVQHGARWDAQGRYVAGPGPKDLGRYQIRLLADREELDVVAYVDPPPRSESPDRIAGPSCFDGGHEIHPAYGAG